MAHFAECYRCRTLYPMDEDDLSYGCSSSIEHFDANYGHWSLPERYVVCCGYGSNHDGSMFKLVQYQEETINKLICDHCIDNMLQSKELEYEGGQWGYGPDYPKYCNMCQDFFKYKGCDIGISVHDVVNYQFDPDRNFHPYYHIFNDWRSKDLLEYVWVYGEMEPKWVRQSGSVCNRCFMKLLATGKLVLVQDMPTVSTLITLNEEIKSIISSDITNKDLVKIRELEQSEIAHECWMTICRVIRGEICDTKTCITHFIPRQQSARELELRIKYNLDPSKRIRCCCKKMTHRFIQ